MRISQYLSLSSVTNFNFRDFQITLAVGCVGRVTVGRGPVVYSIGKEALGISTVKTVVELRGERRISKLAK